MARLKYLTLHPLECLFRWLEYRCAAIADCCAVCPDCGRNRRTGKPCVGEPF